ncbi:hypothetical protein JL720_14497 [Aureococcus anophagefferens]|nr:hypothetical protein JL720_14497 [Aureococcus anophagefferens]
MSLVFGGLRCSSIDVAPIGRGQALYAEELRQATTECAARPTPLAAAAKKKSKGSLAGDDVGPTVAITEKQLKKTNYYQLLGLEKSGVGVDTDLVKRAYHKALLIYHPDKAGADANGKKKAKEGDARQDEKRRAYDSTNAFDETIPSGKEASEQGEAFDFFATYGPVFASNARFAEKLPAPELGGADALEADVDAFYAYWVRFESWRDFGLEAREHDPDAAEDRYEKRWMAKENEKLAKKRKREEMNRIVSLVDRARANDPRLKRFAEEKKAAKQAFKEKRQREVMDKQLAKDASDAALAAEREREEKAKQAAAKDAKGDKVKLKKAKRRAEKLLKAANAAARDAGHGAALSDLDLINSCELLDVDTCARLAEEAGGADPGPALAELKAILAKGEPTVPAPKKKVISLGSGEKAKLPWSEAELAMLDKACKRFKAGAMQRWEQIADYVNAQCKLDSPRTKEECIAKFQEPLVPVGTYKAASGIQSNGSANNTPPPPPGDWSDAQQQQLEAALEKFPASMDKNARWDSIAKA